MRNVDAVAPLMFPNVDAAPLAVVCCHWKRNAPVIPLTSAMPAVRAVSVVNTGMSCAVFAVIVGVPVGGACGGVPVALPLRAMLPAAFPALSVTTRFADFGPAAVAAAGLNVTCTLQAPPFSATVAPHVVVPTVNRAASVPVVVNLPAAGRLSAVSPLFVSVNVRVVPAAAPLWTLPKSALVSAVSVANGAIETSPLENRR